ncbi:MAG: efflux RND transporter periplasmic adaptor subunit [Chitinophagaceae bacterium]|nr:efflux RND transporter periplasmic adaptor subunit [Chitinophagaceae bacterium]MCB9047234.1 efflux RND transporter periplasmic adaptor subunit [Chitinophagales bacterium]
MKLINSIIAFVAVAILFAACGHKQKQKESSAQTQDVQEYEVSVNQDQYNTAGIETGTVSTRRIGEVIYANGRLDVPPQQMVSVSVPVGGFVKTTSMLQGTHVHKGEVIGTLEHMDYVQLQQDYLDTKSQYEYAKTEYARQQELAAENVNAKKALQQAKANYESLQAKYMGLQSKLKLMNIDPVKVEQGNISSVINVYAPINGYVTEVNVNVGQYVTPQHVIFRLVNTEHLHAELTVFEKDIAKVEIGQPVRFTLANEVKERTGTVHLVGKEISTDRTVRIHCHLDEEDIHLLPGMFLSAKIETSGSDVFALPDEAVMKFEGKDYLFAVNDDNLQDSIYRYKMVAVETGSSEDGYTAITLPVGYDKNSQFVVKGAYTLLAKMKNIEEE